MSTRNSRYEYCSSILIRLCKVNSGSMQLVLHLWVSVVVFVKVVVVVAHSYAESYEKGVKRYDYDLQPRQEPWSPTTTTTTTTANWQLRIFCCVWSNLCCCSRICIFVTVFQLQVHQLFISLLLLSLCA